MGGNDDRLPSKFRQVLSPQACSMHPCQVAWRKVPRYYGYSLHCNRARLCDSHTTELDFSPQCFVTRQLSTQQAIDYAGLGAVPE
jgi:hypothetical protein